MDDDAELAEWKTQRDAVAHHLAWLEARIAERERNSAKANEGPAPSAFPPPPVARTISIPAAQEVPEIRLPDLEERTSPRELARGTRLGCFLLALAAILVAFGIIFALPEFLYD
jgi:hypothetical protein